SCEQPVLPSVMEAVRKANETSPPHTAFGFDDQNVSLAMPFARPEASLDLALTFPRDKSHGLNENSLSHWLRLLDDCWPSLASGALCELSVHFLKYPGSPASRVRRAEREPETRIYWASPPNVVIDKPGEWRLFETGRSSDDTSKALDDFNRR